MLTQKKYTECIITHILYHLRDNQKNMLGIFSGESGDMFFRFFKQYLIRIFEAELKDELKKVDVPNNYLYHHISCSFVETLRWWIQS